MDDLRELYQELILDHNQSPRNFRELEHASCQADGNNPLCGDEITLFVELEGDRIKDIGFQGSGCAISKASASIMTMMVKGKSKDEALKIFDMFHRMIMTGEVDAGAAGKLAALANVYRYPARVKCAALAWHTLAAALEQKQETVSTE